MEVLCRLLRIPLKNPLCKGRLLILRELNQVVKERLKRHLLHNRVPVDKGFVTMKECQFHRVHRFTSAGASD